MTQTGDLADAQQPVHPDLHARVAELEQRMGVLEDTLAVRNLQHQYGYYLDKCLYEEVVDLFSADCRVIFMGGIYRGIPGARRLYAGRFRDRFGGGTNGPRFGLLLDHPQLQDVVHVSADRTHAYGRFRSLMQAGVHHSVREANPGVNDQWWEGGVYENTYVREDGIWKIEVLNYRPFWHALYDQGWAHTPPQFIPNASQTYPDDLYGPDELTDNELWPATHVVPFHYPHPVTGAPWDPQG